MPAWVAFWHWKDHYSYYFVFLLLIDFFYCFSTGHFLLLGNIQLVYNWSSRTFKKLCSTKSCRNPWNDKAWKSTRSWKLAWELEGWWAIMTYPKYIYPSPFPFIKTLHLFSSLFSILSIFLPFNIFVISPLNHFLFIPVLYTDLPYAYLPIKQLLYLLLSLSAYSSNLST